MRGKLYNFEGGRN